MKPHHADMSQRTSSLLLLLAAVLTTAAIAATTACSPQQTTPTADYGPPQTMEAMAEQIAALQTQQAIDQPPRYSVAAPICDNVLRNQFVFQTNASTTEALNAIISLIQNQRADQCSPEVWNPLVTDAVSTPGRQTGCNHLSAIGPQDVPSGLHRTGTDPRVRLESGRDDDHNIIIHWSSDPTRRPTDNANCWLYVARLSTWTSN